MRSQLRFACLSSAFVSALLLSRSAFAFALLGPAGFALASFEDFGKGWSWSSATITVSFDDSITNQLGLSGEDAIISTIAYIEQLFLTQSTGTQTAGGGANDFFSPADPTNLYDLESIALHELGHAIGLHHPNQAGTNNFDAAGASIAATGNELMNSVPVNPGEAQRKFTTDDLNGFNHLYPNAAAEPDFTFIGAPAAEIGSLVGADIDFFALNFSTVPLLAPFAGVLALADVAIFGTNGNGPGDIIGADIFFNIPEPGTLLLVGCGLLALSGAARRRRAG